MRLSSMRRLLVDQGSGTQWPDIVTSGHLKARVLAKIRVTAHVRARAQARGAHFCRRVL